MSKNEDCSIKEIMLNGNEATGGLVQQGVSVCYEKRGYRFSLKLM